MHASAEALCRAPLDAVHWSDGAPAAPATPSLQRHVDADVAVVGAGFSGLAAALAVAEAGRSVVVVEAQEPGFAASGRNAAHVAPLFWGMKRTPAQMLARFGPGLGARMNRMTAQSGARLFDLIERLGIECDARRGGYVCVARTPASLAKLLARLEPWRAYGGRFEPVSRDELADHVSSERYVGGVILPDGGSVNPLALSRGLARAALAAGVRIHGHSPAVSATHDGGFWTLRTPEGSVRSPTLLVCVGAYGTGPYADLAGQGITAWSAVAATDPLPDLGRSILPGRGPMIDVDDPAVFGPQIDAGDRLVVSVLAEVGRLDLAAIERIVRPRLRRAFPQLGDAPFVRMWGGRFLLTSDGAPHLIRLGANAYAALGCNGLGHTLAIPAAQELARLALGAPADSLALPVIDRRSSAMNGLMTGLLSHAIAPLANRLGA